MNRLASWLIRLYPAAWRARYGDEMDALLADTGADARVVTDLLRGGVRMQFSTWSFPKLALVLGIAGMLLGAGLAFLLPNQYRSVATLQITPARISGDMAQTNLRHSLNETIQQMEEQVLTRTNLARIINGPHLQLYAKELRNKPLEDVIEDMKRAIGIHFVTLPGKLGTVATAFDIDFIYPDRFKAQQTVSALIDAFASTLPQASIVSMSADKGQFVILSHARVADRPIYPDWRVVPLAGFALGVLLASIWRMVQRKGFIARRFVMVAIVFGIAGMAAVMVAGDLDLLPYLYRSTATFRLQGDGWDRILAEAFSRTSLGAIVVDPRIRLYSAQRKTEPLENVIQTMRQHLAISQSDKGDGVFDLSFDYPDRYKAEQVVSAIVNGMFEASLRQHPGVTIAIRTPPTPIIMDVLDNPSLPIAPIKPNRLTISWLGGIIGLIAAAVIATIRRRWKPGADMPASALPS